MSQGNHYRDSQIGLSYTAGVRTAEIAKRHGITPQRVEQITRQLGLPRRSPEKCPTRKAGGE